MTEQSASFAPDWASPPGDTIVDLIEERGWTQAELAERLGYSAKHVNRLVQGKVALTEDAALRLEPVLGASAGFWLTREARYRERAARPPRYIPEIVSLYDKSSVYAFASKVGVHPGIVVGRLQHDRLIPFGRMNDLKATFRFVEASGA